MVRFLKGFCELFKNENDLDRFIIVEKITAILYIPASVCLALGALGRSGVIPYVASQEWRFFLVASVYLTYANGCDLNRCINSYFLVRSPDSATLKLYAPSIWKLYRGIGVQMQVGSALAMTLGSVSLLNASIIALLHGPATTTELCRRQYALSFAMFLIGSAANNLPMGGFNNELNGTRVLVTFQNIVISATFCVAGILMLPSIGAQDQESDFHNALVVQLSTIGSIVAVISSLMNYFHTLAFIWRQEEFFIRVTHKSAVMLHEEMLEEDRQLHQPKSMYERVRDAWRSKGMSFIWNNFDYQQTDDVRLGYRRGLEGGSVQAMASWSSTPSNGSSSELHSDDFDVESGALGDREENVEEGRMKRQKRKRKKREKSIMFS